MDWVFIDRQQQGPLKDVILALLARFSVKEVADKSRHAAYHITSTGDGFFTFINIDDLERL